MIAYLLKSILCLLVLLLVHRLILQQEVLHRFNRFFLLAAVLGSFFIPLISIEMPMENIDPIASDLIPNWEKQDPEASYSILEFPEETKLLASVSEKSFPWVELVFGIYAIISLALLIRMLRNLSWIHSKIQNQVQVLYRGEILVLLEGEGSPFSFLKYIFLSKSSFEKNGIPEAVFLHERCHARERHTWDILLIEALLIPFWFHPGLYWAKQSIRLNHEFIADQAALRTVPVQDYQQQILSFLHQDSPRQLISSLNFSLTKKRLKMMNKMTSTAKKWMKIVMLIPLLAGIVYLFGEKVLAKGNEELVKSESVSTLKDPPHFPVNGLSEYLALYGHYQTRAYENRLFSQPSNEEIESMLVSFRMLEAKYNQLPFEDRRRVKRASFPFAKIEMDGKVVYKKWEDLSEEEKKKTGC
jgi:hypothetical protein